MSGGIQVILITCLKRSIVKNDRRSPNPGVHYANETCCVIPKVLQLIAEQSLNAYVSDIDGYIDVDGLIRMK